MALSSVPGHEDEIFRGNEGSNSTTRTLRSGPTVPRAMYLEDEDGGHVVRLSQPIAVAHAVVEDSLFRRHLFLEQPGVVRVVRVRPEVLRGCLLSVAVLS